jgi:hypothetical protein
MTVNRSLLARTRPEFYAKYVALARKVGVNEEQLGVSVAISILEARALLDGKCPKCGAPSARYVDYEHQQGPSEVPGAWVMYRCSTAPPPGNLRGDDTCDYMLDLKEGEAAN